MKCLTRLAKSVAFAQVDNVALWLKFNVGGVIHELALEWSQRPLVLYCIEIMKQKLKGEKKGKKKQAKRKASTARGSQPQNISNSTSMLAISPAMPSIPTSLSDDKPQPQQHTTAAQDAASVVPALALPSPTAPTSILRTADEESEDEMTAGVPGGTPMCDCCGKNPLISERELETGYCDDAECGAKCSNCGAFPDQGSEAGDGGDNEHDEDYVDGKD